MSAAPGWRAKDTSSCPGAWGRLSPCSRLPSGPGLGPSALACASLPSRLLPVFAQRAVSKTKEKATITVGALSFNDLEGNRTPISMESDAPVAGLEKEAG